MLKTEIIAQNKITFSKLKEQGIQGVYICSDRNQYIYSHSPLRIRLIKSAD